MFVKNQRTETRGDCTRRYKTFAMYTPEAPTTPSSICIYAEVPQMDKENWMCCEVVAASRSGGTDSSMYAAVNAVAMDGPLPHSNWKGLTRTYSVLVWKD